MQLGPQDQYGKEVAHLVGKDRDDIRECLQAAEAFQARHRKAALKALSKAIGVGFQGLSISPASACRLYGGNAANFDKSHRPRLNLDRNEQYNLITTELLSVGNAKWSQTYKCSIHGQGLPNDAVVVLKLYQETLFPEPDVEHYFPWITLDFGKLYQPADYFVKRESFAYNALAAEQGKLIPWCYGFYKFKLPSGELVEGAVLEYIHGPCLPDYIKRNLKSDPPTLEDEPFVHASLDIFFQAYRRLMDCGVAQADGGRGNVIVARNAHYDKFDVILLDFGLAVGKQFLRREERLGQFVAQGYRYLRTSLEGILPDELCDSVLDTDIMDTVDLLFEN